MKQAAVILFWLLGAVSLPAQEDIMTHLRHSRPGEGKVTLTQDARIEALIGKPFERRMTEEGEKPVMKIAGFRVQVYAGNNSRKARNEANVVAEKVRELFPDLTVYTHFINPRWLCRVGDFRSIEEADAVMRQLKSTGQFKEVSIIRGQINIPD